MATRLREQDWELASYTHNQLSSEEGTAQQFQWCHKAMILLKLDVTKVFYSVFWGSLFQMLQHQGFGLRWRN